MDKLSTDHLIPSREPKTRNRRLNFFDMTIDIPAGVVTGENLKKLFKIAQEKGFAIPAVK